MHDDTAAGPWDRKRPDANRPTASASPATASPWTRTQRPVRPAAAIQPPPPSPPSARDSGGGGLPPGRERLRARAAGTALPTRQRPTAGNRIATLLAELLVIAGVVSGLYVVYTAWWTDVVAVRAQHALVDELAQPTAPRTPGEERRDTPPVLLGTDEHAVFGTMQVPRFGADYNRPIAQGIDRQKVLNTIGLGHYEHTAMPGAIGNFAVAGHRVTYGKPLNQIAELKTGDAVVVRVTDPAQDLDVWYVYKTTDSQIVTPDEVETIAAVPNQPTAVPTDADRWLTLTACHPMWSAKERYVTHAKFDYWMDASEGTPKELLEATT